jgi:hypothetical protein
MHAAGLATMAYCYFDFQDAKKQDCYGLLSYLVLQLSAESDSCYNVLSKLYSDNSRGMRKPDIDTLKKCLADTSIYHSTAYIDAIPRRFNFLCPHP